MVKTFLKADFAFEKLVSDILTNTYNVPCRGRPLWEIQGDLTRIPKDFIFSLDCFIFPAYIFPQFSLISMRKVTYSKVPNKRCRRLLIFTFFSSVAALIPVSTIIKFYLDSFKNSIIFNQNLCRNIQYHLISD